jgi:hypothetical protein
VSHRKRAEFLRADIAALTALAAELPAEHLVERFSITRRIERRRTELASVTIDPIDIAEREESAGRCVW